MPCLGDATSFVFCPSYGLSKGGGIQRRTICSPRSSLVGSDSDWPWVFEDPGRSTELPGEEEFSGFDGLDDLFAGDVNIHQTDYARFEHSKVLSTLYAFLYTVVAVAVECNEDYLDLWLLVPMMLVTDDFVVHVLHS